MSSLTKWRAIWALIQPSISGAAGTESWPNKNEISHSLLDLIWIPRVGISIEGNTLFIFFPKTSCSLFIWNFKGAQVCVSLIQEPSPLYTMHLFLLLMQPTEMKQNAIAPLGRVIYVLSWRRLVTGLMFLNDGYLKLEESPWIFFG